MIPVYKGLWIVVSAVILLLTGAQFVAGIQDPFDFKVDWDGLKNGEPQLFERKYPDTGTGKKRQIAAIVMINAEPEKVWQVLKNWDALGDFVPDVEYYKTLLILEPVEDGKIGKAFIEGRLDVPLFDIRYTLDVRFDSSHYYQEWRMLTPEEISIYKMIGVGIQSNSSGIENIEGSTRIKPYGNGSKALLVYTSTVEYSMPLPSFLEDYIARSALSGYMLGVKKQVETEGQGAHPFSLFSE